MAKALQDFLDTHPNCSSQRKFKGDAYNILFHNLFCESYEEYERHTSTDLFGDTLDVKRFLEEYFKIES